MRRAVQVSAAALCVGSYTGQNPITGAWCLTTTFIAGVFVPVIVFDNRPVLFRSAINHIENVRVFDRVLDSPAHDEVESILRSYGGAAIG